jgi:hypothetical protein
MEIGDGREGIGDERGGNRCRKMERVLKRVGKGDGR